MNSLKSLLNMVATEAVERNVDSQYSNKKYNGKKDNSSPIQYDLELIRDKDGKLHWVE